MPLLYAIECDSCGTRTKAHPLMHAAVEEITDAGWEPEAWGPFWRWYCPACHRARKARLSVPEGEAIGG